MTWQNSLLHAHYLGIGIIEAKTESSDVEIQVPWGHLSAKSWGSPGDSIVLVFHGVMDNAGSFDRLIPLLPPCFRYICFDLPGHGKSSHFPSFFPIHALDYVLTYKMIAQHFNQSKNIIMGHSFGMQIAVAFAQLYPEHVEKLLILDAVYFPPVHSSTFKKVLQTSIDYSVKPRGYQRPSYTYEEALEKTKVQRNRSTVTNDAAVALLKRGLKKEEDGRYTFVVDPRLKHRLYPLHGFDYMLKSLEHDPVSCPVLIILAKGSSRGKDMEPVLNFFRKQKNVIVRWVEGSHDVHNNNPEVVAPLLERFLLSDNNKSKL